MADFAVGFGIVWLLSRKHGLTAKGISGILMLSAVCWGLGHVVMAIIAKV